MLTFINSLFYLILFILGMMTFIFNRKHLLITLIVLEFIVLNMYMYMYVYMLNFSYDTYFSMIFLVFSVCEGSLGLSILVSLIRTHGNDYFQTYNILQC